MRRVAAVSAALALLGVGPAAAQKWAFEGEHGGFAVHVDARLYTLFSAIPESGGLPESDSALVVARLRPSFEAHGGSWFRMLLAWDLVPLVGAVDATTLGFAVASTPGLRLVDFDAPPCTARTRRRGTCAELHAGTGWSLRHDIDRIELRFELPGVDLRVGRQAIGHGSARILPSADVFGPFGPATIDTEYKRGVDGLRVTVPIGETQEVEVYGVLNGTDLEQGLWLLRWRGSFPGIDVSLLAGSSYRQPTLALDLSGDAGGAGWYVEGLLRVDPDAPKDGTAGRITVGVDYKFAFGLRLVGELHYSSAGRIETRDYLRVTSSLGFRAGELFLMAPLYLGVSLDYEATPLLHPRIGWIQNLTDGSALLTPGLAWDFARDVSVDVGAIIPLGKRPSAGFPFTLESEFGTYPFTVYADVRLAF